MKVKLAAQVLSHSVAAGMYAKISQGTNYFYFYLLCKISYSYFIILLILFNLIVNKNRSHPLSLQELSKVEIFILINLPCVYLIAFLKNRSTALLLDTSKDDKRRYTYQ